MARFADKLKAIKVYGFTIGFYALLAAVIALPILSEHKSAAQVKQQFAVVQKKAEQKPAVPAPTITGRPVQLQIERLGIDLHIGRGVYDPNSRTWTLNSTEVFVNTLTQPDPVISTSVTEQPIITVFYGHKTNGVLIKTTDIVPGDILHITTDNGYDFTYYYDSDEIVTPEDVTILNKPNDKPTVAVITCSGIFFQNRRIMYFSPVGSPTLHNPTTESTL